MSRREDEIRRYFKNRDKRRQRMQDKRLSSGTRSSDTIYLPGVNYRVSERAQKFIKEKYWTTDIITICPEGLKGWVDRGDLVIHENTYYTREEVGPDGLERWGKMHTRHFMRAYNDSVKIGLNSPDILLFVTPDSDDIDSASPIIEVINREMAAKIIAERIPSMSTETLTKSAKTGFFWLVISKGNGKLKGTYLSLCPTSLPSQN